MHQVQRGISLIELMVSLALGLGIVASVGYVYLGSKQTHSLQEAESALQQNARFAFEKLSRDVRQSGDLGSTLAGCNIQSFTNVLNDGSARAAIGSDLYDIPLEGFDDPASAPDGIDAAAYLKGDVLKIAHLKHENRPPETLLDITGHNANSATMELKKTSAHGLADGDIVVAIQNDCSHAAMFQITQLSDNGAKLKLVHNTGNSTQPGNCSKTLGPVTPPTSRCDAPAYTFEPGSKLVKLDQQQTATTLRYFIGNGDGGQPALLRQSGSDAPEILVDGAQDLQLRYGIDIDGDNNVDRYVAASEVETLVPGDSRKAKWRRVLAVRASLLLASEREVGSSPQHIIFNGAEIRPADRRLRQVLTATIAIRNRL